MSLPTLKVPELWMMDSIIFYFYFILFYFWVSFFFIILELGQKCNVMSHITHDTVTVTQSGNTEKVIEGPRTDNVIQYSNNILAL